MPEQLNIMPEQLNKSTQDEPREVLYLSKPKEKAPESGTSLSSTEGLGGKAMTAAFFSESHNNGGSSSTNNEQQRSPGLTVENEQQEGLELATGDGPEGLNTNEVLIDVQNRLSEVEKRIEELEAARSNMPTEEMDGKKERIMTPEQIGAIKQRFIENYTIDAITGDQSFGKIVSSGFNKYYRDSKTRVSKGDLITKLTEMARVNLDHLSWAINERDFAIGDEKMFPNMTDVRRRIESLYRIGLMKIAKTESGIKNAQKIPFTENDLKFQEKNTYNVTPVPYYSISFSDPRTEMITINGLDEAKRIYKSAIQKRIQSNPLLEQ